MLYPLKIFMNLGSLDIYQPRTGNNAHLNLAGPSSMILTPPLCSNCQKLGGFRVYAATLPGVCCHTSGCVLPRSRVSTATSLCQLSCLQLLSYSSFTQKRSFTEKNTHITIYHISDIEIGIYRISDVFLYHISHIFVLYH